MWWSEVVGRHPPNWSCGWFDGAPFDCCLVLACPRCAFFGGLCCRVVGPSFWYGGVPKMGVRQCKDGWEWKIRKWNGWLRGVSWVLENVQVTIVVSIYYKLWYPHDLGNLSYIRFGMWTQKSMMARCHKAPSGKVAKKRFWHWSMTKTLVDELLLLETNYLLYVYLLGTNGTCMQIYMYIYISNGNRYEPTLYNGMALDHSLFYACT